MSTVQTIRLSRSSDAFYSLKLLPATEGESHGPRRNPSMSKLSGPWLSSPGKAQVVAVPPPVRPLLAKQAVRVSLYVRCETMWGDKVMLCGSSPQMGQWQAQSSSLVLTTDSKSYPVWRGCFELEVPQSGDPLEYKLVIVRGSSHSLGQPVIEWEPLGENRRIALNQHHASKAAHVGLVWGEPGATLQWRWEW